MRFYQFLKFSIVGSLGFCVDLFSFYLYSSVFPYPLPRILSFISAVIFTYICNRTLTFKKSMRKFWKEFPSYFLSMLGGGTLNLLVFFFLNNYSTYFHSRAYLSIAVGSIAGLGMNYLLSLIVFQYKR